MTPGMENFQSPLSTCCIAAIPKASGPLKRPIGLNKTVFSATLFGK
jgi:hypothetical protein